jgi:WD40-like Beta Propeller Repeat
MKRTTTLVITLWIMFVAPVHAQKGSEQQLEKDANTYFNSGEYLKAFPLFSQLVSLYPNHPDYNYKFGACSIFSDPDKTKAVSFINKSIRENVSDPLAWYYLGRAYHLNYQFKDAIKAYETYISKADPKSIEKGDAERQVQACIYGSKLLSNIKDVVVINKTEADKQNFFRYMDLVGIGGKILTVPDELKSKLDTKSTEPGVIHYPGNSSTIYFSSFGKDGANGKDIYKATILPDGKFSAPEKLKGDVNTKYDEDYCFMHSDGKTLYFASKGHNSMGGYDIFKCIYDPATDSFGAAVNLDFAINTPDDDIFYIADSLNQKAYFASGRTSDLNHLHVYNVMVQGTPSQIIYIKGQYASDIDAEQLKATMKITDPTSGRIIAESSSNPNNGGYIVNIPKSGSYTFSVITENSPTVHKSTVTIPSFDKPVALRQEMKLVKENGIEKLVVTNYFDTPLDEDISALVADMLRRKAGLDINATPENTQISSSTHSDNEPLAFEKTMANAPLAAGYADGVTVATVIGGMEKELTRIKSFVAESDQKYNNGLAYAQKKQKEAEAMLSDAETLRKSAGLYGSESDIKKLRESKTLTDEAAALKREATAAINAAESVKNYKQSESDRAAELEKHIEAIKTANANNDFSTALNELKIEKERTAAVESGKGSTPIDELTAKAKAKKSAEQNAQDKVADLRKEEKELEVDVKSADEKMKAATKKNEKAEAENNYASLKSQLDATRKEIIVRTQKAEELSDLTKDAYANVDVYKRLAEDTKMGLSDADMKKLSETEKSTMTMKLQSMDNRIDALAITDPQMLALITNAGSNGSVATGRTSDQTASNKTENASSATDTKATQPSDNLASNGASNATNTNQPSNNTASNGASNTTKATQTSANTVSNTTTSSTADTKAQQTSGNTVTNVASNGAAIKDAQTNTPNTHTVAANTNSTNNSGGLTGDIHSKSQTALTRLGTDPSLAPSRKMILSADLANVKQEIKILESKKISGGLAPADEKKLAQLNTSRNELTAKIEQENVPVNSANPDQLRSTYIAVVPEYNNKVQAINNGKGTEIEHVQQLVILKEETAAKLEKARMDNALAAMNETDNSKLNEMAKKDQQFEVAINTLRSESNDITPYRAAYDSENKSIIESDATYTDKLQDRIVVTENYVSALDKVEKAKSLKLESTSDPKEAEALRTQLAQIKSEKVEANTNLNSFKSDMQLTAATSEPKTDSVQSVAANVNVGTLEDAIQTDEEKWDFNAPKTTVVDKSEVEKDVITVEKVMKPRKEKESIYAYESSMFDDLIKEHSNADLEFKHKEVIQETQTAILNIEAEMETETDPGKLRKLDYKAEQMYLRRSMIEVENAGDLAAMTKNEYGQEMAKAEEMSETNKEKINSREAIRDEMNRLQRSASDNMEEAAELRRQAPDVVDNIEKADFYRRAFSKEALAIEQLRQIQQMNENIDVLIKYNDEELAKMRNGRSPLKETTPVASAAGSTSSNTDLANNGTGNTAENTNSNNSTENTTKAATAGTTGTNNSTTTGQTLVNNSVKPVTNNATVGNGTVKPGANGANGTTAASKPESLTSNTTGTNAVKSSTGTSSTPKMNPAGGNTAPIQPNQPGESTTTATTPGVTAGAEGLGEGNEYLYKAPATLESNIFVKTTKAIYNAEQPIPIDEPMPQGVYYKVQIGAFKNEIPQNLYDQFAPMSGETTDNGMIRYSAGYFTSFGSADEMKGQIRRMGFSDAFVVAYKNGKRIPLYEAIDKTDGTDFMSAIEKEYINGDGGGAPKGKIKVTPLEGGLSVAPVENKSKDATYYMAYPEAAKATQVETISGLFFTVQVGVYSKPVTSEKLYYVNPLNSELTDSKKIRYTSGTFTDMQAAVDKRAEARALGIADAFITAYYNGQRITLTEADKLIRELGNSVFIRN